MRLLKRGRLTVSLGFLLVAASCSWAHFDLSPGQAKLLVDTYDELLVLDVREEGSEYCNSNGHIAGALNYPWMSGQLLSHVDELPQDRAILVVCASGGRSHRAAEFLDEKGFLLVFDMLGGMGAWPGETVRCIDLDGDGIFDDVDTCPCDKDPNQVDTDEDGIGDLCDSDVNDLEAIHFDITPSQVQELIDSGLPHKLIDVREPSEYCNSVGHIPGALNYPWNSGVLAMKFNEIPKDCVIVVLCQSGGRSNSAAKFLDSQGYHHVFDMKGGMRFWTYETEACE